MVNRLNMQTLEARRKLANAILLYKNLNGRINCPATLELIKLNVSARLPSYESFLFCKNIWRFARVVKHIMRMKGLLTVCYVCCVTCSRPQYFGSLVHDYEIYK